MLSLCERAAKLKQEADEILRELRVYDILLETGYTTQFRFTQGEVHGYRSD